MLKKKLTVFSEVLCYSSVFFWIVHFGLCVFPWRPHRKGFNWKNWVQVIIKKNIKNKGWYKYILINKKIFPKCEECRMFSKYFDYISSLKFSIYLCFINRNNVTTGHKFRVDSNQYRKWFFKDTLWYFDLRTVFKTQSLILSNR